MSPTRSDDATRDAQIQALGALIDVPRAEELGARFVAAGHELYLVGGSVRDAVLQESDKPDLDFATSALPEETEQVLKGWADAVWLTGARFGTVSAQKGEDTIEITTFRSDTYEEGSRHPEVRFGDDIVTDLSRRDFTVNAMAVRMPDHTVFDPFGGWEDLRDRVLRTPIDPHTSFSDDPLRMIRMARFASSLGFRPDDAAVRAATELADQLRTVSAERIQIELDKLLMGRHFAVGMDLLVDTGLADIFLPEVPALRMERDPVHHHKDVYAHTLAVVEGCDREDVVLRLAALLHDIGKPATREFHKGGMVSFHHHDVVGARMAKARLRELKYPREVIRDVAHLVRLHLRFHGYADDEWTDSAVRRYVNDAGSPAQLRRLNALTRADVTTRDKRKKRRFAAAMTDLEDRIDRLKEEEELNAVRPALDGHQMMAYLGIAPGPLVGKVWAFMKDKALELGPIDPDTGYELLDEWAEANDIVPAGEIVPPKPKKDDESDK
ncbi:tRNA nucleotidyltransferase [Euzebya pacifica]|uniref:tRNA nucleotidyltransferase n=1 Tax=Euzebya pacifica TaxID=1608957 RepID=A0A346Y5K2_9ACTN|nr:CCA tRNA nucleotidyltransferase [Euzebya pacifica]AXV09749.1 tRNA nucleotidyltransferase [Euzebya pacifica]